MTLMVMSPYRYTSHFSLRHLSFNLNREVVEVVWANIVNATEPVIQHAYTPNDLLVLEVNEGVYPFISNATQIESYAPSGVKLPPSHDMATQAPALHIETAEPMQSADAEYKATTVVVASMVLTVTGTVKDIAADSTA